MDMNEHTIKLIDRKQSLYESIHTHSSIELETLKAYIKTHIKTRFIQSSKSFTDASILFDRKFDDNFCLYVDY